MTETNLNLINKLIAISSNFSDEEIEASLIYYISQHSNTTFSYYGALEKHNHKENQQLVEYFVNLNFAINIELNKPSLSSIISKYSLWQKIQFSAA